MKYIAIIDADEKPVSCEFIGCNGNVAPYLIGTTTNIKILEQEPCDDVVSRQAVLEKAIYVPIAKVMKDELLEYCEVICRKVVFVDDIKQLPPVRLQEPKTGHWIKSRDCYGNYHFTCSKCGNDIATQYADTWEDKYCSECGAKMVEQKESEDKE